VLFKKLPNVTAWRRKEDLMILKATGFCINLDNSTSANVEAGSDEGQETDVNLSGTSKLQ